MFLPIIKPLCPLSNTIKPVVFHKLLSNSELSLVHSLQTPIHLIIKKWIKI